MGETSARTQLVAVLAAAALLLLVLELVRGRRLLERYALLWLLSAALLLALAIWKDALNRFSELIGISYPPAALFVAVLAAVLALLLHFSLAVSRLVGQSKVLAQRLAATQARLERVESELAARRRADGAPARDVPGTLD